MNEPTPPGWHPDPSGAPQYRYWDGSQWTDHFAPLTGSAPVPSLSRRPNWAVPLAVVMLVVTALIGSAVIVALRSNDTSGNHAVAMGRSRAPHALVSKLATIPRRLWSRVGVGTTSPLPKSLPGPLLTKSGKPRIVYIGAEYCPFCATERWAMVIALSRFGTLKNLSVTASAIRPEVFPDTPTLSFHGSTYTSPYIVFESVETHSNRRGVSGSGYATLDTPTPEQRALMRKYDAPPFVSEPYTGAIPFIDFANTYLVSGSTYSPEVLQGLSHDEVAAQLADPTTDISQGAIGSANVMSAAICLLTHDQPTRECRDPAIRDIQSKIG